MGMGAPVSLASCTPTYLRLNPLRPTVSFWQVCDPDLLEKLKGMYEARTGVIIYAKLGRHF
jgi:hypothetical protein